MKNEKMKENFKKLIEMEMNLLFNKGKEYQVDEDALSNFKENGKLVGCDPKVIASIYMAKHFTSIMNYIKKNGDCDTTESITGRINDLRNYLGLLYCLIVEEENEPVENLPLFPDFKQKTKREESSTYGENIGVVKKIRSKHV